MGAGYGTGQAIVEMLKVKEAINLFEGLHGQRKNHMAIITQFIIDGGSEDRIKYPRDRKKMGGDRRKQRKQRRMKEKKRNKKGMKKMQHEANGENLAKLRNGKRIKFAKKGQTSNGKSVRKKLRKERSNKKRTKRSSGRKTA